MCARLGCRAKGNDTLCYLRTLKQDPNVTTLIRCWRRKTCLFKRWSQQRDTIVLCVSSTLCVSEESGCRTPPTTPFVWDDPNPTQRPPVFLSGLVCFIVNIRYACVRRQHSTLPLDPACSSSIRWCLSVRQQLYELKCGAKGLNFNNGLRSWQRPHRWCPLAFEVHVY